MHDPYFFEQLLDSVPLLSLVDTAREMDGVLFYHGVRKCSVIFDFQLVEPALCGCLEWARSQDDSLQDVKDILGIDQLASLRVWTCTPLCYVMTDLWRNPARTRASVAKVLPFGRLFFQALHSLPSRFIFENGTLYRGEHGVMSTWDAKMHAPDAFFSFFVPTSFSTSTKVVAEFKGVTGPRTIYIVYEASGWIMSAFSPFPQEEEVLLEPVTNFKVLKAEKYDSSHSLVRLQEMKAGLHLVEGRVRPGVGLLDGSRVKALEEVSYRTWLQQQKDKENSAGAVAEARLELQFDPFSEQEWIARDEEVPESEEDRHREMSVLGEGTFGTTYRMTAMNGEAAQAVHGVTSFAVKVVTTTKKNQIKEEDVRREAKTLSMMLHKNVVRYFWLEKKGKAFWIVMERADGDSVAAFIQVRAQGQGVQEDEVLDIMKQISSAIDYIHSQGIVHRDIKADNLLFAHAEGAGPRLIKLADFGASAIVATNAASALQSKVGTQCYYSPERGRSQGYGVKSDMWALGCVLLELLRLQRLTGALWDDGYEVSQRRELFLQQSGQKSTLLGKVARGLLCLDKHDRIGAVYLKHRLEEAAAAAALEAKKMQEMAAAAALLMIKEEEAVTVSERENSKCVRVFVRICVCVCVCVSV